MMMPTISANCWSFSGTANFAMISRKMNRLSTRERVLGQPAREVLARQLGAGEVPHAEAEEDRRPDVDGRARCPSPGWRGGAGCGRSR